MKLIMTVSLDGFVAKHDQDNMSWSGKDDKAIFKILTLVGGKQLCVSKKTYSLMPKLVHRIVTPVSTKSGIDLRTFYHSNPDAWLLGGQTLALEALKLGYIDEMVLCMNKTILHSGIRLHTDISNFGGLLTHNAIKVGDLEVMLLRK